MERLMIVNYLISQYGWFEDHAGALYDEIIANPTASVLWTTMLYTHDAPESEAIARGIIFILHPAIVA
jgi:hypothetical protein